MVGPLGEADGKVFVRPSVCGLFCPACVFYIGTHADPSRLERMAAAFHVSTEAIRCDGCGSKRRDRWFARCLMGDCAESLGHQSCGECSDYPCAELKQFLEGHPYRKDIYRDMSRIRETGADAWLAEAAQRYSCSACGCINTPSDLGCRSCGQDPSSPYVEEHRAQILARVRQEDGRRV